MRKNDKKQRMRELVTQLEKADVSYYKYDEPVITDREYDRLVEELKELEEETGIILAGSPTQKVSGEILEELAPVRHTKPMLSADKTKSMEDLLQFVGGKDVILSWKLDGLTLVLRYDKGKFKQAVTRGKEGITGEDVTHTVRHFLNVPLSVPEKGAFEVRGEGVISWENFRKFNKDLSGPYSHPRGLAAGSVRKLDTKGIKERKLEFFAFELIRENDMAVNKLTHFDFLEANGFQTVGYVYLKGEETAEKIEKQVRSFEPEHFGYPADGLIMEYANLAYGKSLGATGHHENRMLAYKWEDELYETKFLGIDAAVTRNGMVSLTGVFEPVEIDGTVVERAYLHNMDIFQKLKLGKGDTIKVYKANMIIPQIAENETKSGTAKLPGKCPCCGEKLHKRVSRGGTRQLFCENPHCAAKLVKRFVHFCEKTRMDIEGLSEKTLEKFIGRGLIRDFGDLYRLERHKAEIIRMEGFGEKSFARLQKSIEKSRHAALDKFIAAMGIPMVGRTAGRTISSYFHGSFTAFEKALKENFDFTKLPDFGETMHENLYAWYTDREEEKLWRPLLKYIEFKEEETMRAERTVFTGKTVVATGKLQNYTRNEINAKITSLGAKAGSSVTGKTDFLIVGEKAGSKLEKARKLGVTILSERAFEEMIA